MWTRNMRSQSERQTEDGEQMLAAVHDASAGRQAPVYQNAMSTVWRAQ